MPTSVSILAAHVLDLAERRQARSRRRPAPPRGSPVRPYTTPQVVRDHRQVVRAADPPSEGPTPPDSAAPPRRSGRAAGTASPRLFRQLRLSSPRSRALCAMRSAFSKCTRLSPGTPELRGANDAEVVRRHAEAPLVLQPGPAGWRKSRRCWSAQRGSGARASARGPELQMRLGPALPRRRDRGTWSAPSRRRTARGPGARCPSARWPGRSAPPACPAVVAEGVPRAQRACSYRAPPQPPSHRPSAIEVLGECVRQPRGVVIGLPVQRGARPAPAGFRYYSRSKPLLRLGGPRRSAGRPAGRACTGTSSRVVVRLQETRGVVRDVEVVIQHPANGGASWLSDPRPSGAR